MRLLEPKTDDSSVSTVDTSATNHHNSAHQIDSSSACYGRWIPSTKRRMHWKFGFSNIKAPARKESGAHHESENEEEHSVSFVWSLISGKRLILCDGRMIHFSVALHKSCFSFSWVMDSGHICTIVARGVPILRSDSLHKQPQFELLIDGSPFSRMKSSNQAESCLLLEQLSAESASLSVEGTDKAPLYLENHDMEINEGCDLHHAAEDNFII